MRHEQSDEFDSAWVKGPWLSRQTLDRILPATPCKCGGAHASLSDLAPGCHLHAAWTIGYADGLLYFTCSECQRPWWVVPVASDPAVH